MRMLRIIAIMVFALLLGIAANSLSKMYASGTLFDRYNSARKSSLTLVAFSVVALVSLGSFELRRIGKSAGKRRYGEHRYTDDQKEEACDVNPSSIYAAPVTIDEWKGRRISASRPHKNRLSRDIPEIWMSVLRVICLALPVFYAVLFAVIYLRGGVESLGPWLFVAVCSTFISVSIVTAIGVFAKKSWGLSIGYLLAIFNLVIFPVGTAVGLILLIALVGSSSVFSASSRPRNRMHSFV